MEDSGGLSHAVMGGASWGGAMISRTVDVRFPADLDVPDGHGLEAWCVLPPERRGGKIGQIWRRLPRHDIAFWLKWPRVLLWELRSCVTEKPHSGRL